LLLLLDARSSASSAVRLLIDALRALASPRRLGLLLLLPLPLLLAMPFWP